MAKLLERRKVVELRKQGKSYSEIKKIVSVSKSSLSLWLENVPLTNEQILGLKRKKERAVERFIKSMKLKRENRLNGFYKIQTKKWIPLSTREKFIAGLFLYWGEGSKKSFNNINITNTDPAVIKFSLYWIENCLLIPKNRIFIKLHLYKDMDIQKETDFWIKELGVNKEQFKRPYIKDTFKKDIDQKGFGHGTCGVWAYKTKIKENILMAIKAISDGYALKA